MFQGAERDIIYLSMVCSRGSCPAQNQQFHFQRANVALSRARDRCVLVRSIDLRDIPSMDDMKIPIIEFFMNANHTDLTQGASEILRPAKTNKSRFGSTLLKAILEDRGYELVDMGVVWKGALCVEQEASDTRAAIMVDCDEGSSQEWLSGFAQQKAIERVGWKCIRINAASLSVDYLAVVNDVIQFLASVGIKERIFVPPEEEDSDLLDSNHDVADAANPAQVNHDIIEIEDGIAAVSSEDDDMASDSKPEAVQPDDAKSELDFDRDDRIDASKFGEVVNLDFLLHPANSLGSSDDFAEDESTGLEADDTNVASGPDNRSTLHGRSSHTNFPRRSRDLRPNRDDRNDTTALINPSGNETGGRNSRDRPSDSDDSDDEAEFIDQSNETEGNRVNSRDKSRRSQKRRRLDKSCRDGRWDPEVGSENDPNERDANLYDSNSDLTKGDDNNDDDESWQCHDMDDSEENQG